MGNPDSTWWHERDGIMLRQHGVEFDAGRLRTGLEVIANKLGKRLDEDNPLLNAQLPDGSRICASFRRRSSPRRGSPSASSPAAVSRRMT